MNWIVEDFVEMLKEKRVVLRDPLFWKYFKESIKSGNESSLFG